MNNINSPDMSTDSFRSNYRTRLLMRQVDTALAESAEALKRALTHNLPHAEQLRSLLATLLLLQQEHEPILSRFRIEPISLSRKKPGDTP